MLLCCCCLVCSCDVVTLLGSDNKKLDVVLLWKLFTANQCLKIKRNWCVCYLIQKAFLWNFLLVKEVLIKREYLIVHSPAQLADVGDTSGNKFPCLKLATWRMRARISLNILFDLSKKEVCKQNQKQNGSSIQIRVIQHTAAIYPAAACCWLLIQWIRMTNHWCRVTCCDEIISDKQTKYWLTADKEHDTAWWSVPKIPPVQCGLASVQLGIFAEYFSEKE